MPHTISDEVRYRLLAYLQEHPEASQRELAAVLGVSVGKINYCIQALVEKGLVKMRNFRKSRNKLGYAYILTPQGMEEKFNVTDLFLRRKIAEFEEMREEIERLTSELREAEQSGGRNKEA